MQCNAPCNMAVYYVAPSLQNHGWHMREASDWQSAVSQTGLRAQSAQASTPSQRNIYIRHADNTYMQRETYRQPGWHGVYTSIRSPGLCLARIHHDATTAVTFCDYHHHHNQQHDTPSNALLSKRRRACRYLLYPRLRRMRIRCLPPAQRAAAPAYTREARRIGHSFSNFGPNVSQFILARFPLSQVRPESPSPSVLSCAYYYVCMSMHVLLGSYMPPLHSKQSGQLCGRAPPFPPWPRDKAIITIILTAPKYPGPGDWLAGVVEKNIRDIGGPGPCPIQAPWGQRNRYMAVKYHHHPSPRPFSLFHALTLLLPFPLHTTPIPGRGYNVRVTHCRQQANPAQGFRSIMVRGVGQDALLHRS
jgi:hypothetical protein